MDRLTTQFAKPGIFRRSPTFILAVIGAIFMIIGCADNRTSGNSDIPPKKVLDHFKFYKVEINIRNGRTPVRLKGQFDNGFRDHILINLTHFGNPVSKNNEGIQDKFAHLAWYRLACTQETQKTATITNQFGRDVLTVEYSQGLLAPAKKIEPGQKFPKGLNHFKLYRVDKFRHFEPKIVALKDQFDKNPIKVKLIEPKFLAVPVAKKHAGKFFPKLDNANDQNHLVLYRFKPIKYDVKRTINDQFQGGDLSKFYAKYLAVPSGKPAVIDGLPEGEKPYFSANPCRSEY